MYLFDHQWLMRFSGVTKYHPKYRASALSPGNKIQMNELQHQA